MGPYTRGTLQVAHSPIVHKPMTPLSEHSQHYITTTVRTTASHLHTHKGLSHYLQFDPGSNLPASTPAQFHKFSTRVREMQRSRNDFREPARVVHTTTFYTGQVKKKMQSRSDLTFSSLVATRVDFDPAGATYPVRRGVEAFQV